MDEFEIYNLKFEINLKYLNIKILNSNFKLKIHKMLTHTDLKKGTQFIYENQPWEVIEALLVKMAQRRPVIQTKIKNLEPLKVCDHLFFFLIFTGNFLPVAFLLILSKKKPRKNR